MKVKQKGPIRVKYFRGKGDFPKTATKVIDKGPKKPPRKIGRIYKVKIYPILTE